MTIASLGGEVHGTVPLFRVDFETGQTSRYGGLGGVSLHFKYSLDGRGEEEQKVGQYVSATF